MKAVKTSEVIISAPNSIGLLDEIAACLAKEEINIRAICAYIVGDTACIRLITSDNTKTKEILKDRYTCEEKEVVLIELPDRVGELTKLTSKVKSQSIDLKYLYGTTSTPHENAILILSSSDNGKLLEILTS